MFHITEAFLSFGSDLCECWEAGLEIGIIETLVNFRTNGSFIPFPPWQKSTQSFYSKITLSNSNNKGKWSKITKCWVKILFLTVGIEYTAYMMHMNTHINTSVSHFGLKCHIPLIIDQYCTAAWSRFSLLIVWWEIESLMSWLFLPSIFLAKRDPLFIGSWCWSGFSGVGES